MNTYRTISEEISDLRTRQAKQVMRANMVLGLVFVLVLIAAAIAPFLANVSYYGVTNSDGLWLHDGPNIAGFTDKNDALSWLANPTRRHSGVLNFRPYQSE